MTPQTLELVVTFLSISAFITPVIFFAIAFKLSQIFATKKDLEDFKKDITNQIESMNGHILDLLQRTSVLRKE
jgi:predicted PurR-regulated permease PerM